MADISVAKETTAARTRARVQPELTNGAAADEFVLMAFLA